MNNLQGLRPLLQREKHPDKPYRYLTPTSILLHGGVLTTASKVGALFRQQKSHFEMLQSGLVSLEKLQFRHIELPDGTEVLMELNERRRRNTANHHQDVASGRLCFLCAVNQDPHERALYYDTDVSILTNPNPVLSQHIVVSYNKHQPQSFLTLSADAFAIARELQKSHFVFFNGIEMGATAPDHAHLQAADRSSLPLETFITNLRMTESNWLTAHSTPTESIRVVSNISRGVAVIQAKDSARARELTGIVLSALDSPHAARCNIVLTYQNHQYRVYVFPRRAFRPDFFSADPEDVDRVGISPAAVELMGIVITPFQKDFDTLTADSIDRIYDQTCMKPREVFSMLSALFKI